MVDAVHLTLCVFEGERQLVELPRDFRLLLRLEAVPELCLLGLVERGVHDQRSDEAAEAVVHQDAAGAEGHGVGPADRLVQVHGDGCAVDGRAVADQEAAEDREHRPRDRGEEQRLAGDRGAARAVARDAAQHLHQADGQDVDGEEQDDDGAGERLQEAEDAVDHQLHLPEDGHADDADQPADAQEPDHPQDHQRRRIELVVHREVEGHDEVDDAQRDNAHVEHIPHRVAAEAVLAETMSPDLETLLGEEDACENELNDVLGVPPFDSTACKPANEEGISHDHETHHDVHNPVELALLGLTVMDVHDAQC
mmetsp:Transcript_70436/g.199739  ORF Transcript_70436/g.199739 Transcript_70436/m.199739 type:complete len:310 (+) Transcript_70436:841-1770(+)